MAEEGQRVTLNIYDVSKGVARQVSTTFLGKAIEAIWHTGIIVYGKEYYFGAGRSIQDCPAGSMPHGSPVSVVDLGVTLVTKDVFDTYLQGISPRYTAETYSLLSCNCNHFTNEVAQFLVDATIPDYILQLPNEILSSPMGALMVPMIQNLETTFRFGAVPQAPQFSPSIAQSLHPTLTNSKKSSSDPNSSFEKSLIRENDNELKDTRKGSKVTKDAMPPNVKPLGEQHKSSPNGVARDPLGDARNKVQEEIVKEFTTIMATGTMRVSEAMTHATMRVIQKLGQNV